jgi:hypothetical protein
LAHGFTQIVSITELADGRVLVADQRERTVVVADLLSGSLEQVGRVGQGPGEYTNVTAILPLGPDSSLMADSQTRRWLILDGDRIVYTVPINAPVIVATGGVVLGADANGFILSRNRIPPDRVPGANDSIVLVRVRRVSAAIDTIGKLGPSSTRIEVPPDRPQTIRVTIPALGAEEQTLAFPDGWIAVARLNPYRVDWRSSQGTWTYGRPLPFNEIPLNDREQQAHREYRRAIGLRDPSAAAEWPSVVPPFIRSAPYASLVAAPDGRLLVARTPTAERFDSRYDIVDRAGRLVATLALPVNERIVAVGKRGVYVVETTELGLQYVRRHPWPE